MNGKGRRQDPKRLAKLFLHPKAPAVGLVAGEPPSSESVLADVYNEALREAFYRDEPLPDAKVVASTVMASVVEPLERNPWFLSDEGGRRSWARLSAEHLIINRARSVNAEELREPAVATEMELNWGAGDDEERAARMLDFHMARERVDAALSETQREILVLFLKDQTAVQIAEELEASASTIRKELNRINKKFRVALTGTNTTMPRKRP